MFKMYINIYKENPKIWGFALSLFLISTSVLVIAFTDVFIYKPLVEYRLFVAIVYLFINKPFIRLFQKRLRGEEISFDISYNIKLAIHNVKIIFAYDKIGWSVALFIVFAQLIILAMSNMFSDLVFFILMPILIGLFAFYKRCKNELQNKGML